MERPRWIGFDLGGTLIRARREERLLLACYEEGVTRDRVEAALQVVDRYFMQEDPQAWHQPDHAFLTAYARLLAARLGLRRPPADLVERVRPCDWTPYPDTEPQLRRLAAEGYRLGLVTNWSTEARGLLCRLGLAAYFDLIVVSAEIGHAKPEPLAFWPLVEAAAESAPETLFLGDNYWSDVVGAWHAGLQPVLIDRVGVEPPPMSAGYRTIASLAEIGGRRLAPLTPPGA